MAEFEDRQIGQSRGDVRDFFSPRVIIVGAGISGIAAANHLIEAGIHDVHIVEATSRVGGRIHSIDLETDASHKVELGANWVHGNSQNPIFRIAEQNNLLSRQYYGRSLRSQILYLQENGRRLRKQVVEEVNMKFGSLMLECESFYHTGNRSSSLNDSIGAFVKRGFETNIERLPVEEYHLRRRFLLQRLQSECIRRGANSMDEVSLSEFGGFEDQHGYPFVVPYGFEKIIDLLKANVPSDCIYLNHPVRHIFWNDLSAYPVCVECSDGKKFYGDICLVTVSLGFLQKHAGGMFSPELPLSKTDAIGRIVMGTVNKIILEFDGQILPKDIYRLEMIWDTRDEEIESIGRNWIRKIPCFEAVSSNILMGWLSGKEAEYVEQLTDAEVGERCVEALESFLQNVTPSLPKLLKITRSYWWSNLYTLGSYCHIPVGGSVEDIHLLAEPVKNCRNEPVLLFAGEATDQAYFSSSHGALLSGRREAERIISYYKRLQESF